MRPHTPRGRARMHGGFSHFRVRRFPDFQIPTGAAGRILRHTNLTPLPTHPCTYIYIYIWIKYAARNLRCMGYTLKTKSHKGQESRTRSQGPGAIDQEPRTKSQAYMQHGVRQNNWPSRHLRCTNIHAIFFHSQHQGQK